jgi:hypothetical protein
VKRVLCGSFVLVILCGFPGSFLGVGWCVMGCFWEQRLCWGWECYYEDLQVFESSLRCDGMKSVV